jgi:hypothetical protein
MVAVFAILESGRLLETLYERSKVRPFRRRFHDRVQVIGHQAVRKSREVKVPGVVQKLLDNSRCVRFILKHWAFKSSARR